MPNTPRESRRSTRSSENLEAQKLDQRVANDKAKVKASSGINTADASFAHHVYHASPNKNNHVIHTNNSSHSGGQHSVRRGSKQQSGASTTNETRLLQAINRTNSAPLLELGRSGTFSTGDGTEHYSSHTTAGAKRSQAQDDDEVAGVVGAIRHFQPFQSHEFSGAVPEINIAVFGSQGVGKSTFVKTALGITDLSPSQAAERKIPVDGSLYLVRLLELPIDDIDLDDDDTINWPETIEDKMMPRVDGALALYDVTDKSSIEDLREMLTATSKAALPTVLVSCKCDTPPSEREIDPSIFEQNAKRAIGNLTTLQVSKLDPESHKAGVSTLLKTIVHAVPETHRRSASRRRAQSSANLLSSRSPASYFGHSRASSEHSGFVDLKHARVDSSFPTSQEGRLQVTDDQVQMHSSFLLEESTASERSADSTRSSLSAEHPSEAMTSTTPSALTENGAKFEELVDRLLAQPTSKVNLKFADIFLALYRKFAAPSKLLDAVTQRFDALEHNGAPLMMKSTTQLRYLTTVEKWVSTYPGDFAFPKTRRRLQTFASKLTDSRIFAAAAREINIALEAVEIDDDTNWAFNDEDRETSGDPARESIASLASTLIDDPNFTFDIHLSGSTMYDPNGLETMPKIANQLMVYVEQAQKVASQLQPTPRNALTKEHWRMLMEQPDDLIAKELTRMDWIMFSSIRPRDLVRHVSLSKDEKATCKNLAHVERMIEHFNQVACWVANYVLLRDKPKHRALMLEKFMRIARKLRELNNYNALGAIIAGVKSTAVHRLSATRELLPQTAGKDWLKLEILMAPSRSHFAYRLAWENSSSERIPYLPLHRRDLATAEEGNKSFIGDEKDGRISWKKFEIMGEVIVGLQRAQGMPYKSLGGLVGNKEIKELILDVKLVKDEEDLYNRSVQLEPPANAASGASAKFKQFFQR